MPSEAEAARIEAERYDAMYGDATRRDRRYSRLAIMAVVFVVGAGAGLSAAKWFSSVPKYPQLSAPAAVLVPGSVAAVDAEGEARYLRGIRASELPYDGRAPDDDDQLAPPAGDRSAPAGETTISALQQSFADPQERETPAISRQEPTRDTPVKAPPDAAPASTKQTRRAETPSRPSTRTSQVSKEKENHREIERMRRQAEEELSRKTRVAAKPARVNTEPTRLQQVSTALASCERRSNIILREHCRWQVCNGMWGKNGCPSYASTNRDPYAY